VVYKPRSETLVREENIIKLIITIIKYSHYCLYKSLYFEYFFKLSLSILIEKKKFQRITYTNQLFAIIFPLTFYNLRNADSVKGCF
jgi:hypothetical protein